MVVDIKDVFLVEIGTGTDLHGQNVSKAAVRACKDAIGFNSVVGLKKFLPNEDLTKMVVKVTLGLPAEYVGKVDLDQVRAVFPFGTVLINVKPGGLAIRAGVSLAEQGDADEDESIIIVNAAVQVGS